MEYIPVLLFKQQGQQPSKTCSSLASHDFLLVLQNEFQRDMLRLHGTGGACTDATYKINDNDFHLITLMVLDDFQEGVPVAWALSNREDRFVLIHILTALKEECDQIHPAWFTSDMAPQYFHAWKEVKKKNTCGVHGILIVHGEME